MINSTRGLITEALTDEGWTLGATVADDGGGGAAGTAIVGDGTVACRIDALGAGEAVVANRLSDRSTHIVTLPPGSAITTEGDFFIDGRGTFEVTAVRERTDELSTVFEVVERD